jgi:CRP/FNR family transcriptional regulator, cyclic AMP receptor protein
MLTGPAQDSAARPGRLVHPRRVHNEEEAMKRKDQPTIDRLRRTAPFTACTQRQLEFISRRTTEYRGSAGEQLAGEGTAGREFFVIIEGSATVFVAGRAVATLRAGDCFGEVALLDWGTRTATVVAHTDMVLAVCGAQEFSEILHEVPSVARKMLIGLSARLRAAQDALSRSLVSPVAAA